MSDTYDSDPYTDSTDSSTDDYNSDDYTSDDYTTDSLPEGTSVDVDNDGVIDGESYDLDGDGADDAMVIKDPVTGETVLVMDTNADGEADVVAVDTDGDGMLDEFMADTDGDGQPDTFATDEDGDGLPDGPFPTSVPDASSDSYDTTTTDPYDSSTTDPYETESTDPYETESTTPTDSLPIDINGDGIDDGHQVDSDGDGTYDTAYVTNPDSGLDEVGRDTDGDGTVDEIDVDTDGDGVMDTFYTDTDGDGHADEESVEYDTDGDGMPDGPFTSDDTESYDDPYDTDPYDTESDDTESESTDPYAPVTPEDDATTDPYDSETESTSDEDGVHGDPQADKEFHTVQPGPVDCLPTSVAMVLSDITGEEVPAEEVVAKANEAGFMSDQGMQGPDALALLEAYGVDAEIQSGTIDDLKEALDNGDQIIVGIDAADVYANSSGEVYETAADAPGSPVMQSGHAIEITGVSDGPPPVVYANDPGFPGGAGVEIPLEVFEDAWDDGDNMVIVAENPHAAASSGDESNADDVSETVGSSQGNKIWLLPITFVLEALPQR